MNAAAAGSAQRATSDGVALVVGSGKVYEVEAIAQNRRAGLTAGSGGSGGFIDGSS